MERNGEYLLSSVASWSAPLLEEVGRVRNGADHLLPVKVGSVLKNSPSLQKLQCFTVLFAIPTPPLSVEFRQSFSQHETSFFEYYKRYSCYYLWVNVHRLSVNCKIYQDFSFLCLDRVILYLSITPKFLLFSLFLLQYCCSSFSIQSETQI